MTPPLDDFWKWLRTAPLPVVLALVLALAGWMYVLAADVSVQRVHVDTLRGQFGRVDEKLDKLLEAVAELRAEQRASRYRTPAPATSPAPKEK